MKKLAAKIFARLVVPRLYKINIDGIACQNDVLSKLISDAQLTQFGIDHQFKNISDYNTFKASVPVRDYEGFRPYIEKIKAGEKNILWKGLPRYFSKTSGTTSGVKYIPISNESMGHHITAARNALLCHVYHTGNADFVNGKMIFLQGSPLLDNQNIIPTGRLSGIVANYVPAYLQKNRLPSFDTNCIEDWETKVNMIVDETLPQDMRLISGIPSWVQMYFEKALEKTGKITISELFPRFDLFVYGGVNFEPYRARFRQLMGKDIPSVETFPASEGFFAFQDLPNSDQLLLNVDAGIFFEFIPVSELDTINPNRLTIENVELNTNYALVVSTNAGLWAYNMGDTIKFTSLKPYRIKVTGRTKHFISAFGEHVIAEEVEDAISYASNLCNAIVDEFTLAPQINPEQGLPYHEWFVEFAVEPSDLNTFSQAIDQRLSERNTYYKDLIVGKVLRGAVVNKLKKGSFVAYMRKEGKLGGQNKIPKLLNNRMMADFFNSFV